MLVPREIREQKDIVGKSIGLLDEIFNNRGIEATEHVQFLRDLNHLRNKADGHRKGGDYVEARHRFGTEVDLRLLSHRIMKDAVSLLEFLCEVVSALQGAQDLHGPWPGDLMPYDYTDKSL